ncbi:MAG: cation transporter [Phycisphaerales bacterium]|nr:cation transporter [Phycisphaerales bacterium]
MSTVLATGRSAADASRRAVLLCVVTTAVVAATELLVGYTFSLLSVTAEGLHTLADLLDSLVALVLVSIAIRPPDKSHPFGHGKFDSLAGVIEGLCVAASGVWAIVAAVRALLGLAPADPRPGPPAIAAMLAASVLYVIVSRMVLRIARQTGSAAVYAEGMHLLTHVYITGGLVVALSLAWVAERADWPHAQRIDPVVAKVLGVYLVFVGIRIVWVGCVQLSDAALPTGERERLADCLREFSAHFVEVHAVRTRRAGAERHIDIHLVVPGTASVDNAHELAHRIERRVVEVLPGAHLLVHVEPASPEMLHRHEARGGVGGVLVDESYAPEHEGTHHGDALAHRTR